LLGKARHQEATVISGLPERGFVPNQLGRAGIADN
jgi:hypothetical protein